MPSLMIHLLTAYKYSQNMSISFKIGNVAPDVTEGKEAKDKTHFRDRIDDRLYCLTEYAKSKNIKDEYVLGTLLHLYTDFLWDEEAILPYKEKKGEDWFLPYRSETSKASSFICHTYPWGKSVWEEMFEAFDDPSLYFEGEDMKRLGEFVKKNGTWHLQNDIGPSEVYTPDCVEHFCESTAKKFKKWIKNI